MLSIDDRWYDKIVIVNTTLIIGGSQDFPEGGA